MEVPYGIRVLEAVLDSSQSQRTHPAGLGRTMRECVLGSRMEVRERWKVGETSSWNCLDVTQR